MPVPNIPASVSLPLGRVDPHVRGVVLFVDYPASAHSNASQDHVGRADLAGKGRGRREMWGRAAVRGCGGQGKSRTLGEYGDEPKKETVCPLEVSRIIVNVLGRHFFFSKGCAGVRVVVCDVYDVR